MDKLMATLKKMALEIATLRQDVDELQRREIPAGLWKAYTPASQTGWTALPTGTYRYAVVGKLVFLVIAVSGTSNATTTSIALPFAAPDSVGSRSGATGYAVDNGVALTGASRWAIVQGGGTIDFYSNMALGAWTASGTKAVYCTAIYERV